jgi:GDP-L-fucose synthase
LNYKDKKVLVTGGTGLIGRQVVDLLVEEGANVHVISLDDLILNDKATYWNIDLRDFKMCQNFTKTDYVFHLAGIKASPDITKKRPATMSVVPLQINTNILEACRINKVENVLFTSSIGAYQEAELLKEEDAFKGEPMDSAPGHVKRIAERQIQWYQQEYGLNYKAVRLANTYGPGDNFNPDNGMFISSLMAKVLRGDNPVSIWGNGLAVRDFTYSGDIAKGILQIMQSNAEGIVNLGSGLGYAVNDVVLSLQLITDFNFKYDISKPSGVAKRVLDISKARSYGYEPSVTLMEGLLRTWEWFIKNPREYEGRLNYFVSSRN